MVDPAILSDLNRLNKFDLVGWGKRNSKEVRWGEISQCAKALKDKYKRVGVIGYCYGGWSSFQLGSDEYSPRLVDCEHPTLLRPSRHKLLRSADRRDAFRHLRCSPDLAHERGD